ncbi:MAG: riboflavin synthase [Thermoprotei archaeon]|nr:MAG: riboflavin synthase [Thermoprotei archaeon]
MTYVVGIIDTTFSRVDMAKHAIQVLGEHLPNARIVRYTVPGIKDIPVAAKRILEDADIAMTFGWVGPTLIDKHSYLAMSIGLIMVQVLTGKHVVDVTVHEDEAEDPRQLYEIAVNRAREHALNVVALLKGREALTPYAGRGLRQGLPDVGPLR